SESEMEVLVIDDGSTDSTPQILAENALRHNNLRVMRQPNQGQSVARNWGIEEAQGEYIFFVDSDDALTTPCPLPFETMKMGKYDMIGMETLFEDSDGTRRRYCHQRFPIDHDYITCRDYLKTHNVLGIVYGYLFRTSFVKQHAELRFTPGIYHQDEEFIVKAFCLGEGFVYKQGYTYVYYKRVGSSIHTFTRERKVRLMRDLMIVIDRLIAWGPAAIDRHHLSRLLHCKLSWMSVGVLRFLIKERHDLDFTSTILAQLKAQKLYPLPFLFDFRYLALWLLTINPVFVKWWIKHPALISRWI
ncbi:MAG: glycosyltransferase, partial [Bacteroidales bacterium]|nr:glycosyltransferase [Bacteroidales bacterium]